MENKPRLCPNCKKEMVFAPNGRFLICERCGYKQPIERPRRTARELSRELKFKITHAEAKTADGVASRATNVRDLLARGIEAAKVGLADEAHFYLEWVLTTHSTEAEQARAWWWLSQVYEDPADQRECLEQVLAINPNDPEARRGMAILDGRLDPRDLVDANQVKETAVPQEMPAQAQKFTCPQCAAAMNYTPDGQFLRCGFCGFQQSLTETAETVAEEFGIGEFEQDFIAALSTAKGHLQPIAVRTFQCQSCTVEFVLAPEAISLTCPYCDSVYVTKTAETRELLPPQALIPFRLNEDEAKKRLRAWFKENHVERPKVTPIIGIYLPIWTFDASGEIKWGGYVKQGDNWVYRSGIHYEIVDDFRVPASHKLPANIGDWLRSFDYQHLVAYDARYLADWPAERYQIPLADASLLARKGIVNRLRRNADHFTGGNYVRDLKISTAGLTIQSFKLILLPLWMTHYKLEGDVIYTIFINGQTGTIQGQKPEGILGKLASWLRGS